MNKQYLISVEHYNVESEEGPTLINGELNHIIDGVKLCIIDSDEDHAVIQAKLTIQHLLSRPIEYISKTFPKFYKISLTKQYWFHLMEKDFIDNNQLVEKDLEIREVTLEDNLSTNLNNDAPLLNAVDKFFDRDLNELDAPPDRINFWEQMGLDF